MNRRSLLLMLTAGAATLSIVTSAMSAAADPQAKAVATRLGATIAKEMEAREAQAADRERALKLKEQMIAASENRLKADVRARAAQEQAAAQALVQSGPPQPNQYDALARVYQAMKPAKAAIVLEQLDLDVQVAVAKRMRERSTAMVLAAMTPAGAARLSMALAGRRSVATPSRLSQPVNMLGSTSISGASQLSAQAGAGAPPSAQAVAGNAAGVPSPQMAAVSTKK